MFELNPYERCIVDKVIDEHQLTIKWFVDENKVSNMDDSVNMVIDDNSEGKNGKLSCTTRKNHTFLGIDT